MPVMRHSQDHVWGEKAQQKHWLCFKSSSVGIWRRAQPAAPQAMLTMVQGLDRAEVCEGRRLYTTFLGGGIASKLLLNADHSPYCAVTHAQARHDDPGIDQWQGSLVMAASERPTGPCASGLRRARPRPQQHVAHVPRRQLRQRQRPAA
jgi:hypothetical protein